MSENINIFFDENELITGENLLTGENDLLNDLLNEINEPDEILLHSQDIHNLFHEVVNYNINYTVKQLLQICEYYNISKEIRMTKCNKDEIINIIVLFEHNPVNYDIICRRKQMWFYINELKNDKFMKKYVLW